MKFMRLFIIGVFAVLLFAAMFSLPEFGTWGSREVAEYYIEHGAYETGSANLVNAIVWDFRGYDTMGEETVLFTAALGVFLIMRRKQYGYYRKKRK
jgi:multisubunit Na+/H+ antiporter MnhB subunit